MLSAIKRLLHHSGKSNAEIKMKLVPLSIKELKSTILTIIIFHQNFTLGVLFLNYVHTNGGR